MQSILKEPIYKAFGFRISSRIPFPELQNDFNEVSDVDIRIELADLTPLWKTNAKPNSPCVIKDQKVLFQVPKVATFLIENGNKITVSPMDGSNENQIRLFLLGSCMGAILIQRKVLPLHGSALAINGKAYAIIGDSGAGKSTLASALLNKGYKLLSDDVIPVTLNEQRVPIVTPAYPQQKLWQESLDVFGMNANDYQPIFDRETKFTIPVRSKFSVDSLPLAGVFELVKTKGDHVMVERLSNLQVLPTLYEHTYRQFFIDELGLREWHFQMTATIANRIQVYRLHRPIERFTVDELSSQILNTLTIEVKD